MLLADNKNDYEYCLAKKTVNLIRDANRGCLSADELGMTVLLNNQFQAMLNYEPPGTVITPGYQSIATLDFTSFSSFGDLMGVVVIDGVVIASLPEDNYPDVDALLDALDLAINTTSTLYTATNQGSGVFTIEVVTPGTSLNGTEVSVEINPTFFATEQLVDGRAGNLTIVNDPANSLYGKLHYGGINGPTFSSSNIRIFDNGIEAGLSPLYPPQSSFASGTLGFPYALSTFITAYSETDQRFLVTGRTYGLITFMSNGYSFVTNPNSPPNPNLYTFGIAGSLPNPYSEVVWNPANNRFYVSHGATSGLPGRVSYITSTNTVGTAQSGMTGVDKMCVNTNSSAPGYGDVWVCGTQAVYVIDTANSLVATFAGTAGHVPLSITYCPSLDRVYVAYRVTASPATSYVRAFDAAVYTIQAATFYTINAGANSTAVFYSTLFNVIFVNSFQGAVLHTDIVKMDGTLSVSIPITSKDIDQYFAEDLKNNKVWSVSSEANVTETSTVLRYFEPGVEGEETIEAAFYGGVDPVISDGEDNCLSQDQVNAGIQKLNKECIGCTSDIEPQLIPPSGISYLIYYGNSIETTLDASEIESDLTAASLTSYIGSYSFSATSPSEYKFWAIPSLLGTPSRFYDPSTGFDVAMDATYSVTINSVAYSIYRTYNAAGGAATILIT